MSPRRRVNERSVSNLDILALQTRGNMRYLRRKALYVMSDISSTKTDASDLRLFRWKKWSAREDPVRKIVIRSFLDALIKAQPNGPVTCSTIALVMK